MKMKRQNIIIIVFLMVTSIIIAIGIFTENCETLDSGCQPFTASTEAPQLVLEIASTNTISDWTAAIATRFNSERHTTSNGEVISVNFTNTTSGDAQRAILNASSQPDVWIAGNSSWVETANEVWMDLNRTQLVSDTCTPTVATPIGLAMWQPMAEAFGYPNPVNIGALIQISMSEEGWGMVGHPEWGNFKFGHSHPDYSDDGLLALSFISYRILEKLEGVTPEEIYSEISIGALYTLEQNTYHYGIETSSLLELMAIRGPQYLHVVASTEADVLRANDEYGDQLRFPLVFVYPQLGTFWGEHTYCVLDTDWVTESDREAAAIFSDYLLAREQQELAMQHYLRPVNPSIELTAPFTLENGTNPEITSDIVPAMEPPSAGVASAVRDIFHMVKKPTTVILVLDTSGSMEGDSLRNAANSASDFISRLDPRDEVYVIGFSDAIVPIGQGGIVADIGEALSSTVRNVIAGGGTSLYDAVCNAIEQVDALSIEHSDEDIQHLYGIVVLSDGEDTSSNISENQMYNCLPDGESVEEVKIYTIAYGANANQSVLTRIANRTNGQFFTADQQSIEQIYIAISAEQ